MKKPWFFKYLDSRITQIWGWSPERKAAKKRAQVGPQQFKCEECGAHPLVKGEYEVDHTVPRMPPTGWDGDWTGYIARSLEMPVGGLKVLCKKQCHRVKSAGENASRRKAKKAKKANNE